MHRVTDLTPIKPAQRGIAVNKAGRIVMRGFFQDKPVKVYECANAKHAFFIENVSKHKNLKRNFPDVLVRHRSFLIVDWVIGETVYDRYGKKLNGSILNEIATLQYTLHMIKGDMFDPPYFDYWFDLILPRFLRAIELMGEQGVADSIVSRVNDIWDNSTKILMHPDLSPHNILVSQDKKLLLIDNELITIGGMPLLDVCNASFSLGAKNAQKYAALYLEKAKIRPTSREVSGLQAAWLSRCVGSAFIAGDLVRARHMLNKYLYGKNILPITL